MQLETGKRRFGWKHVAVGTAGGEAAGNPARLLTFGTSIQLGDQGHQPASIIRTHEPSEVLTGHRLRSTAEGSFSSRVHAGDVEFIVQLDDRIHRAAEKPPDLLFPLTHLRFRPQALQLSRSPRSEDLKDGMDSRFLRNRTAVDHRHVSENMPIRILE